MDPKREALITCAEALGLCRPFITCWVEKPPVEAAKKALDLLDIALEQARAALSGADDQEGGK